MIASAARLCRRVGLGWVEGSKIWPWIGFVSLLEGLRVAGKGGKIFSTERVGWRQWGYFVRCWRWWWWWLRECQWVDSLHQLLTECGMLWFAATDDFRRIVAAFWFANRFACRRWRKQNSSSVGLWSRLWAGAKFFLTRNAQFKLNLKPSKHLQQCWGSLWLSVLPWSPNQASGDFPPFLHSYSLPFEWFCKREKFQISSSKVGQRIYLKWSCSATFKSKLSLRSTKPIPTKAVRLVSSFTRRSTKYRDESDTASIAGPGYFSIGHWPKNCPVDFSSSFMKHLLPFAMNRRRQFQFGSSRFQSEALTKQQAISFRRTFQDLPVGSVGNPRWYPVHVNIGLHQQHSFIIVHCGKMAYFQVS